MICPNCRAENRIQARFCKRCGGWLAADCPSCHAALPEASLFCDQCGRPLNAAALTAQPVPSGEPPDSHLMSPLPHLTALPPPAPQPYAPTTSSSEAPLFSPPMSNHWLDDQLHTLEAAELIHEIARQPEIEYTFRHSLTQEATYTAILMRRRRDFHRQVGEAIETLYADRLDEFYPMLAHHFSQADDPRSLHYDRLAGDAAFRSFAIAEALVHYARAAKSAQTLDAPAEQLTHLHLRAGRCKELQGDYAGAIKFYTDLEGVAGLRNDPAVLLAALQAQATAYTIPTRAQDVDKARSLIAQALHLADQSGDQAAQAKILWTDLILHLYSGSAQEGVSSGERSVALARQLGLRELLAHVLQDLAMVYMGVGHARAAVIALVEAGPLWQEAGNLAMLAENRAHFCFYHVIAGNLAEALALADEAHQIATRIDNRWGQVNSRTFTALAHVALGNNDAVWATTQFGIEAGEEVGHPAYILNRIWRSMLYENLGDGENALTLAREADRAGERFRPFRPFSLAHLARMLARQGRLDEAVQLRKECTLHGGTQTLFVIDVWIGALDVELSLFRGDLGPALDRVHRLIDWLLEIGARFFMPEMLRLKAATLCAMGEQDQAITSLQQGVEAARDMGMRCPTWQMLMELARLQEEQGNSDSQSSYAEARSLLDWIAAHTTQVQVVHP